MKNMDGGPHLLQERGGQEENAVDKRDEVEEHILAEQQVLKEFEEALGKNVHSLNPGDPSLTSGTTGGQLSAGGDSAEVLEMKATDRNFVDSDALPSVVEGERHEHELEHPHDRVPLRFSRLGVSDVLSPVGQEARPKKMKDTARGEDEEAGPRHDVGTSRSRTTKRPTTSAQGSASTSPRKITGSTKTRSAGEEEARLSALLGSAPTAAGPSAQTWPSTAPMLKHLHELQHFARAHETTLLLGTMAGGVFAMLLWVGLYYLGISRRCSSVFRGGGRFNSTSLAGRGQKEVLTSKAERSERDCCKNILEHDYSKHDDEDEDARYCEVEETTLSFLLGIKCKLSGSSVQFNKAQETCDNADAVFLQQVLVVEDPGESDSLTEDELSEQAERGSKHTIMAAHHHLSLFPPEQADPHLAPAVNAEEREPFEAVPHLFSSGDEAEDQGEGLEIAIDMEDHHADVVQESSDKNDCSTLADHGSSTGGTSGGSFPSAADVTSESLIGRQPTSTSIKPAANHEAKSTSRLTWRATCPSEGSTCPSESEMDPLLRHD
ncbi:unnamed protein product [Amoebophrya sp. A120]|nr:unnamed protein product [Amoebophrya sp. A120]|eukprot:GSA120T00014984001.1